MGQPAGAAAVGPGLQGGEAQCGNLRSSAATVFEAVRNDCEVNVLSKCVGHLAEIHAAPQWLWPALARFWWSEV